MNGLKIITGRNKKEDLKSLGKGPIEKAMKL